MSTSIHCRYTGALHCQAEHGPSGSQLHTDAPSDHAGLGENFAPTDLVATALGTCVLTIMGIAAKERGWDLEGAELSVEKTMQPEPRRIASLELSITLPSHLNSSQRQLLQQAANQCPVKLSLEGTIPMHFRWL